MEWKPRLIEPDELVTAIDLSAIVFGVGPRGTDDYRTQVGLMLEPERTFVVDDGDVVAGTGSAFTYDLAVPGGTIPMAAVTEVGVAPTHRRRGILRAIMAALVDQALDRGEPAAGLTASEGLIYRRFGYGVAARYQGVAVARARSAELPELAESADEADAASGRLRLIGEDEAATVLPAVWARHWSRVPGEVSRNAAWWRGAAVDTEYERDGGSARYIVVHDGADGQADGFAVYRMKYQWPDGDAGHQLSVVDVAAADDRVERALLRYLLDVDLVRTLQMHAPVDLPLRWRLVDPRAVHVTSERDHLWLRPLDVARCLAARRYAAEGSLVLEVVDGVRPDLGGRFRLEAGAGGTEAAAARTTDEPDLALAMPDLGAALLGGVSWATLQRAGLVDERRPGSVAGADALFRPGRAPFCATDF